MLHISPLRASNSSYPAWLTTGSSALPRSIKYLLLPKYICLYQIFIILEDAPSCSILYFIPKLVYYL